MAPYKRRDLLLIAVCILVLFFWVHFFAFDSGTDDEFSNLPFPIDHGFFGSKHMGGEGVRKGKVIQRPLSVDKGGKQEAPSVDKFGVRGPNNRPNSTLGFGAIIAVSTVTSTRREPLKLAGELTGLKITIPDQPKWTDEDVNNFKAKNGSTILRGSVLAWLGHLNALKWFIEQPFDTAMIIEDDVDWDIHLRSHQIPLLSKAFHEFVAEQENTKPSESSESSTSNPTEFTYPEDSYWPSTEHWELLYLGHCGDYSLASKIKAVPHKGYEDPNMPAHVGLHTDTQRFMKTMAQAGFPYPKGRVLHRSLKPLCTFAYAINKETARRMIKDMSHEAENYGTIAYDVRILEACRDWNWKCWTINPELFHHQDGEASEIRNVDGGKPSLSNTAGWDQTKYVKPSDEEIARGRARGTPNISCGIRMLVHKLGVGEILRKVVRMSMEVDGLCPMAMAEIDGMREHIFMNGRDEIEIGD